MSRTEQIKFRIDVFDFDHDLGAELKAARDAVFETEKKIIKAFNASDRLKAMRDIAGTSEYVQKNQIYPRINGGHIEAEFLVDLADQSKAPVNYGFNITEKTANLLLSGKFLTDAQKRALVKRMGFDLDALSDET
jgi:hypothetical protein